MIVRSLREALCRGSYGALLRVWSTLGRLQAGDNVFLLGLVRKNDFINLVSMIDEDTDSPFENPL